MQRPVGELLELRGATRRFTGSYERSSFTGNDFPTTSWVADRPRVLDPGEWRLEVAGLVERPAELTLDDLDAGDELVATLDCTGGFYSRQRWRGIALERLLSHARPVETATHLRAISRTGTPSRWCRATIIRFRSGRALTAFQTCSWTSRVCTTCLGSG